MFEFSVRKDMKKRGYNKGGGNRKGRVAHLYPTLIVKESKMSVEHGRVVTTLNIIKH